MSEFINLEDLTEEQAAGLDDIDDPEAIMALLNGEKPEESTEPKEIEPKEEPQEENTPEDKTPAEDQEKAASDSDKKEDVDGESSDAEDDDDESDKEPQLVLTKDGKHAMPFTVVTALRENNQALKAELNSIREKLEQEQSSNKSTLELLAAKGIDLEAIKKGDDVTDEMLDEIDEADPGIGKVVRHLISRDKKLTEKLESLQSKSEPVVSDEPPHVVALKANPDLLSWMESNDPRWDVACYYNDSILEKLPEWKDKPPAERFAEAVKRTKTDFGDLAADTNGKEKPTQQKQAKAAPTEKVDVDEALKKAETRPPSSLTDLGQPPATEKSKAQQLADIDNDDELIAKMSKMSESDLEAALAEALGI